MATPNLWAEGANAAGNIFGGVAEYYGNKEKANQYRQGINAQMDAARKANQTGQGYYSMLEKGYSPEAANYDPDLKTWRDESSKGPSVIGDFDTSKYTVNSYLDPSMKYQQEQAANAVNQSAAARGGMFAGTGATAKALQDRATNLAQQDYGNAFSRMQQDRQFGYGTFTDKFASQKAAEDERLKRLSGMLEHSGTARENLYGARGNAADLSMSTDRALGDYTAGKYNISGDLAGTTGKTVSNTIKGIGTSGSKYLSGGK
jgi:hypothetical protein